MAIGIPGVDETIFQDLFEGDVGMFKSVLNTFVEKTPAVLKKLSAVSKETLQDYATTVHGLKGACATVCAEEARKAAFKLETMSRDGDLAGVLAENGTFLKHVEDLLVNLQNWLRNN